VRAGGAALSASLGKRWTCAVEPAPADEVSGAPTELLSAMSNLVSNAVRYTPGGGASSR
jgi:two-component system phosphate regulon sensor histidine kinase PhoR